MGMSFTSTEMQSTYLKAPADWAVKKLLNMKVKVVLIVVSALRTSSKIPRQGNKKYEEESRLSKERC